MGVGKRYLALSSTKCLCIHQAYVMLCRPSVIKSCQLYDPRANVFGRVILKPHISTVLMCFPLCFPCILSFVAGTTREHLGLAMALKVPFFIVISKVDLCSKATVERTVKQLERILKQPGCNKLPLLVTSDDDAVTAAQQFAQSPK